MIRTGETSTGAPTGTCTTILDSPLFWGRWARLASQTEGLGIRCHIDGNRSSLTKTFLRKAQSLSICSTKIISNLVAPSLLIQWLLNYWSQTKGPKQRKYGCLSCPMAKVSKSAKETDSQWAYCIDPGKFMLGSACQVNWLSKKKSKWKIRP